jgi:hypothetical protein
MFDIPLAEYGFGGISRWTERRPKSLSRFLKKSFDKADAFVYYAKHSRFG